MFTHSPLFQHDFSFHLHLCRSPPTVFSPPLCVSPLRTRSQPINLQFLPPHRRLNCWAIFGSRMESGVPERSQRSGVIFVGEKGRTGHKRRTLTKTSRSRVQASWRCWARHVGGTRNKCRILASLSQVSVATVRFHKDERDPVCFLVSPFPPFPAPISAGRHESRLAQPGRIQKGHCLKIWAEPHTHTQR